MVYSSKILGKVFGCKGWLVGLSYWGDIQLLMMISDENVGLWVGTKWTLFGITQKSEVHLVVWVFGCMIEGIDGIGILFLFCFLGFFFVCPNVVELVISLKVCSLILCLLKDGDFD